MSIKKFCAKTRFRDAIAAKLSLARIQNRGYITDKDPKRVYKCPKCYGWHLTSQIKKEK